MASRLRRQATIYDTSQLSCVRLGILGSTRDARHAEFATGAQPIVGWAVHHPPVRSLTLDSPTVALGISQGVFDLPLAVRIPWHSALPCKLGSRLLIVN